MEKHTVKAKFIQEQAMTAHRGSTAIQLYSSFNLGTRWGVGGQHHAPAALPLGKTWYPLYRKLDRPQGQSGQV
jgi:hypothetical protein